MPAPIAFLLTVVGIVVGITVHALSNARDGTYQPGNNHDNPDPASPKASISDWIPDYTMDKIQRDPNSPQALAYNWTLNDPSLAELEAWRVRQRFALASLYYATDGPHNWYKQDGWLNYSTHECDWHAFKSINRNSPIMIGEGNGDRINEFFERFRKDGLYLVESDDGVLHTEPCNEDPESKQRVGLF